MTVPPTDISNDPCYVIDHLGFIHSGPYTEPEKAAEVAKELSLYTFKGYIVLVGHLDSWYNFIIPHAMFKEGQILKLKQGG